MPSKTIDKAGAEIAVAFTRGILTTPQRTAAAVTAENNLMSFVYRTRVVCLGALRKILFFI